MTKKPATGGRRVAGVVGASGGAGSAGPERSGEAASTVRGRMIGSRRAIGVGVGAVRAQVGGYVIGRLGAVLLLAVPALARAAAWDVEARTEAQAYTISPWRPASGRALERRRLVQDLDLAAFEVGVPHAPVPLIECHWVRARAAS